MGEEEEGQHAEGFPPVSVNLVAAYAAGGKGDEALTAFPAEDVRGDCEVGSPPMLSLSRAALNDSHQVLAVDGEMRQWCCLR